MPVQELRDVKLVAQSAQAEVQQLQELLGALKSKAADTARQLSAARTAVHDAQQDLSAEQQHAQRQASLMEELRTELDKARRCGTLDPAGACKQNLQQLLAVGDCVASCSDMVMFCNSSGCCCGAG